MFSPTHLCLFLNSWAIIVHSSLSLLKDHEKVCLQPTLTSTSNGSEDIHLITPPSSSRAIEAALSQNPHLTSLPLPTADVLAPKSLSQTSGTAEILRHPDVQAVITGDFLVLPCDLLCEVPGDSLLEAWMVQESGLGGAASDSLDYRGPVMGLGGERGGRRGGMGVWYQAKTETSPKGAETDFVITTALPPPASSQPSTSLRPYLSKLVYATTTDTLRDITAVKEHFPIRHGLIRRHGRIRMLTTHRDAHLYIFPHWVLDFISRNERFDSISEDVVGWWAKSTWQDGLAVKLGLRTILDDTPTKDHKKDGENGSQASGLIEDEIDLAGLSSTHPSVLPSPSPSTPRSSPSRPSSIPPIVAYVHPSAGSTPTLPSYPLLLRVDTPALLLRTSLHLATLPPSTHPFSHPQKTATPSLLAAQTNIHTATTLLDSNVTVASRAAIRESVLGSSCAVGTSARILQSVLMEEVEIGERAVLTGCVVGRRARVGKGAILTDCEVQGGFVVEEGTEAKGEKFMVFEGMDEEQEDQDEGLEEGRENEEIENSGDQESK